MFEGENEDREQDRGKATSYMLAIAILGIAGNKVWVGDRYLGVGVTGLPRDEDQGMGSGDEENGSGNEENGSEDEENGVWERGERGLRTRRTGSENEENGV
jgi:hypothetical protein